jgi:hypothetical protein
MNKLLLATAMLAALAAPAFSAEKKVQLPISELGPWCFDRESTDKYGAGEASVYLRTAKPNECKNTDKWFDLGPNGYEAHEVGCDFTKIEDFTKSGGLGKAFRVHSKCGGEALEWEQKTLLWFIFDAMVVKVEWHGPERDAQ